MTNEEFKKAKKKYLCVDCAMFDACQVQQGVYADDEICSAFECNYQESETLKD